MSAELDQQAIDILLQNDRGGYTVPTARLYPYQWNWDSAFVALGFATFDIDRAWRELELLLEGQWQNGMIPHILFRQNDPDYFPGPSVWRTPGPEDGGGKMPSGGISQPPVLASVVFSLFQQSGNRKQTLKFIEPLMAWHRWWQRDRTPKSESVIASVHPWETGRDNCPDWEAGLAAMEVDPDIEPYERRDTSHIDPSMRPSKIQYDKYVTMIKAGRDVGWDQRRLTDEGPFLMADPGLHFILLRANRDLLKLVQTLGLTNLVSEIEGWIEDGVAGSEYLWNAQVGAYCARNVADGTFANGFSSASALCFYAGVGNEGQQGSTLKHLNRIAKSARFMMPSWDPKEEMFEQQRYWCGPLWCQVNRIIAQGLSEAGHRQLANRMRDDLAAVIQQSGFYECFDPITGDGCIGSNFSWTAAMWLSWASPTRTAKAA